MKFAQAIEFKTRRIHDLNTYFDAWISRTAGSRVPHRAVLRRDRAADDLYQLMVEFSSYDQGMANSARPATAEFAAFLAGLCDEPPTFRNLDVLRVEDL